MRSTNSEQDSSKPSNARFILCGLLAVLLMVSVGIYAVITARMQPRGQVSEQLVGTWRSERVDDPHGLGDSIWDLRSDGSARWRLGSGKSLGGAGNRTGYFEWWLEDPASLNTHQFSSKSAAMRAKLISIVLGPVAGRTDFELIDVSENEFTLRTEEGKAVIYRRTQDAIIEALP